MHQRDIPSVWSGLAVDRILAVGASTSGLAGRVPRVQSARVSQVVSDPSQGVSDEAYMREALRLATLAGARGDVPVGALVVQGGRIVGRGFNTRERDADPTGHAEIVALREACREAGRWRVDGATLYVTLEPCPMCAGALVNARVGRLVYGASDAKAGAVRSLFEICDDPRLNHRMRVEGGLLSEACAGVLQDFFRATRERKKAAKKETP